MSEPKIDDELHLFNCDRFLSKILCLRLKMNSILPGFLCLNEQEQFVSLMCPSTPKLIKLVNKFIRILFESRDRVQNGESDNEIFLNI